MAVSRTETFRFTEDDLILAARLFAGKNLTRPKVIAAYVFLWLAALIFFMSQVSGPGRFDLSAIGDGLGPALGLSILPLVLVFFWFNWLIPTLARRNFRLQRSLHGDFRYGWDADKLAVGTEYGSFDMPWSHFLGWTENGQIFLLFESDRLYRVIPKRVLSPDQQTDLRHHLARVGV